MKAGVPTCVLTIAGSDSGGGAGVQADARTIQARGGFACMAITAVTAQNTRGVVAWRAEPPALIAAQIAAVLGKGEKAEAGTLPVRAIKTGLLPGRAAVHAVAIALKRHPGVPLVIDPVIGSTTGTRFLNTAGLRALRNELLPRATLVTPNWPEAAALTGCSVTTFAEAETAARTLSVGAGCAVLLKGGHAPGRVCRDILAMPDGTVHRYDGSRIETPNTHGTGCVLSSAIATELGRGATLERAVVEGRRFLRESLRRGRRLSWGGAGPAYTP